MSYDVNEIGMEKRENLYTVTLPCECFTRKYKPKTEYAKNCHPIDFFEQNIHKKEAGIINYNLPIKYICMYSCMDSIFVPA